jgi:glycine oxidase
MSAASIPSDVVVIGGGLIGMLTARLLNGAGLSVTLLERGQTGRESSWAGGGILSPLHPWRYPDAVSALADWSQRHYERLAEDLARETGIDPEWTRSGLLVLDPEAGDAALSWCKRWGQPATPLSDEGLRAAEPALGETVAAQALLLEQVAQIRNPRLVKALRRSLDLRGVRVVEQTEVQGLDITGARVQAVRTEDVRYTADAVVVTAGAWTATLVDMPSDDFAIEPVRGQMLLLRGEPGFLKRIVLSGDRYLIPRRDGRILVGSTVERVGFDKTTTDEAHEDLRAAAIALIPELERFEVERHWAGLRPGSPRGIPYIGPHPGLGGLYINAGHYRNGVVLGLASARLLADLLTGAPAPLPAEPYRVPDSHIESGGYNEN